MASPTTPDPRQPAWRGFVKPLGPLLVIAGLLVLAPIMIARYLLWGVLVFCMLFVPFAVLALLSGQGDPSFNIVVLVLSLVALALIPHVAAPRNPDFWSDVFD